MNKYSDAKKELARKDKAHNEEMARRFPTQINESIQSTQVYNENSIVLFECANPNMEVIVENLDTVSAVHKFKKGNNKLAVLNFASFKHPGGGFMNGSVAQEEAICRGSNLYNVIGNEKFKEFYKENLTKLNNSLYMDRGLYSPNIIFKIGSKFAEADVITVASPNKSAYMKIKGAKEIENTKTLKDRIKFVLDIAGYNEVKTLILGAFGCGVFGQDPYEVAQIFKEILPNYGFEKAVFAVPVIKDFKNFKAFEEVFKR